ncbi:hypothetical protein H1C71_024692 [Ictidomys tridecemlineatus]|nr:hypothetical protein H1C71_024692 [Ictidomys tridecemlineatus]
MGAPRWEVFPGMQACARWGAWGVCLPTPRWTRLGQQVSTRDASSFPDLGLAAACDGAGGEDLFQRLVFQGKKILFFSFVTVNIFSLRSSRLSSHLWFCKLEWDYPCDWKRDVKQDPALDRPVE